MWKETTDSNHKSWQYRIMIIKSTNGLSPAIKWKVWKETTYRERGNFPHKNKTVDSSATVNAKDWIIRRRKKFCGSKISPRELLSCTICQKSLGILWKCTMQMNSLWLLLCYWILSTTPLKWRYGKPSLFYIILFPYLSGDCLFCTVHH